MIRLAVRVRREHAELALAELLTLAPGGVEERDLGDRVEYAIYGAPGELPELPDLQAAAGDALVEVSSSEVADDWEQRWRRFHRAGGGRRGRLRVRPPWAPRSAGARPRSSIDPGRAFGTGAHPTTRLCLELLLELEPGGPLLDLGCGSGVLAIAAARLGWAPVVAVDHDPLAVEATADNARANGSRSTSAPDVDLRTGARCPRRRLLLANLLRPLLLELARAPARRRCRSALIAGGLLVRRGGRGGRRLRSAAACTRRGAGDEGDWAALLLCDMRRAMSDYTICHAGPTLPTCWATTPERCASSRSRSATSRSPSPTGA